MVTTSCDYHVITVYEELLKVREGDPPQKPAETLYVNPHPNCSLIHPDEATTIHMQKLGLQPLRDVEEEDHKYWALADSASSSDWESNNDEDVYDDILNVMTKLRCSKRQTPIISEHIYYLPPDCYEPLDHL